MKLKIIQSWAGLISLLWISTVFFLLAYLFQHSFLLSPFWLYLSVMFGWWAVGLVFAIPGLRHGHLASRMCAALTIGVVLFFIYEMFFWKALARAAA